MSEPEWQDVPVAGAAPDETFLGRWSRLKAEAREREIGTGVEPTVTAATESPAPPSDGPTATEAPAPPPLPDIETLGEDSDYSAFLSPGVDAGLRRLALRKLFHSPKFNVFDGLDTYRDDFTSFPPLGDVVTADMRHHLERAARELAARAEAAIAHDAPSPAAAAAAAEPAPTADPPAADAHDADTTPERNENDAEPGPA